jgi:hypothetical protein
VCFVTAGAILLSEGRASSLKDLAALLKDAGIPGDRQGKVVQALTPYAEVVLNSRH